MELQARAETAAHHLTARLDGLVERWNRDHESADISIERSTQLLLGARTARMYRRVDGILTLRFFEFPTGDPEFTRLSFLVGGSIGFTTARTGMNLALRSDGDVWVGLDISENPLNRPDARSRILTRSREELSSYLAYFKRGLSGIQVQEMALKDEEIQGLLLELTQLTA